MRIKEILQQQEIHSVGKLSKKSPFAIRHENSIKGMILMIF